jgi:SseB protein N-terminal domain
MTGPRDRSAWPDTDLSEPKPGDDSPRLDALLNAELIVPIRSSVGAAPDPATVPAEAMRHGTDANGERFLAAFTSDQVFTEFGPHGSDSIRLAARQLFDHADQAQERVVVDPGAPTQVEVTVGVLPFLAAGIDPNRPDALRARRPLGGLLPQLAPATEVPEPFGAELRRALEGLPQVERAWLLRAGEAWTAGIQMVPEAALGEFDAVRNRLHALATEHLGSRRQLAVTDLRAPSLLDVYQQIDAPFYVVDRRPRGFLKSLFGN